MSSPVIIRDFQPGDVAWATRVLAASWGSTRVVTRGRLVDAASLPGFVATITGDPAGLLTYRVAAGELEIVTLNSLRERAGVGSALVAAALERARQSDCRRAWLITTNDNLPALGFYQKRGFRLVAVHRDALTASRRLKPEIPLVGLDGIALRDEIELDCRLYPSSC
jgi:ribosomal protein S18 acetylase RimI-like enzyme